MIYRNPIAIIVFIILVIAIAEFASCKGPEHETTNLSKPEQYNA